MCSVERRPPSLSCTAKNNCLNNLFYEIILTEFSVKKHNMWRTLKEELRLVCRRKAEWKQINSFLFPCDWRLMFSAPSVRLFMEEGGGGTATSCSISRPTPRTVSPLMSIILNFQQFLTHKCKVVIDQAVTILILPQKSIQLFFVDQQKKKKAVSLALASHACTKYVHWNESELLQ